MSFPKVVSREEWLAARRQLRAAEQDAAVARDLLSAQRRALPMVEIDTDYRFEGPEGEVRLLDLFEGRGQLIVYHFMFAPEWDEGCKHCSYLVDNIGHLNHLYVRDTSLVIISRAPQAKIAEFGARMEWNIPWYSSYGSGFNYDFHVTIDESVAPIEYDFKDRAELEAAGETWFMSGEQGGLSVFVRDGDRVFHTYSLYGPGNDLLHGTDNYLDLTPRGWRDTGEWRPWLRHHDKYDI